MIDMHVCTHACVCMYGELSALFQSWYADNPYTHSPRPLSASSALCVLARAVHAGSNEILLSKDKTVGIVDGSGVLYDDQGLDREELTRLATERLTIDHFSADKLSDGGFRVLVSDRNITLPARTVQGVQIAEEEITNGMQFRNDFHTHPLAQADLFVPCGGRPASVHLGAWMRLWMCMFDLTRACPPLLHTRHTHTHTYVHIHTSTHTRTDAYAPSQRQVPSYHHATDAYILFLPVYTHTCMQATWTRC